MYSQNNKTGNASAGDTAVEADTAEAEESTTGREESLNIQEQIPLDFTPEADNEDISITTFGAGDVFRIFLILLLIIGITYLIIWFLRKLQNKTLINSNAIEILSTQTMQQGSMLYVVKTGANYFLLAVTGQSITLVKEFSEKEERDELELALSVNLSGSSPSPIRKTFLSVFNDIFKRRTTAKEKQGINAALSRLNSQVKRGKALHVEK